MNLPLQLDRESKTSLQDQLFDQLRQLIRDGKLKPNTRIIATRFLAEQTGVSRTTALLVYERLISEGYLETRPAVGTYVAAELPDAPLCEAHQAAVPEILRQAEIRPMRLPPQAQKHGTQSPTSGAFDFSPAKSDDTNVLSPKVWLRGARNALERHPECLALPSPAAGAPVLRHAIAVHLTATRGMMVAPEQIFIVAGRREACSIVAHLFQRVGDRVVLEAPGDVETEAFFKLRRAEIGWVPVDERGLRTDDLPSGDVALAYVTPDRHNPLGGIMPLARREALIDWARSAHAYVVEDDNDAELRYHGPPPPPLAALDVYGLVFHTGSFAKAMGAGLGLGYLVVPPEFVDPVSELKSYAEANCSWLEQMVLADLLVSGEYHRHLRRVRKIYMERRDCLVQALTHHFGAVSLMGVDAGTQLTWLLPDGFPLAETVRGRASARGVTLGSVSGQGAASKLVRRFCERALIFGFAAAGCDGLREGIACLANAIGI